ncbi:hypothetical protein BGZ94_003502, partial [Podila epigama]
MASGRQGPFQRLERGEIDLWSFYKAFSEQLSLASNVDAYAQYATFRGKDFDKSTFKVPLVDGRELFIQMMSRATVVNPRMVHVIESLRKSGFIVAALTNNFNYPTDERGRNEQQIILDHAAKTLRAGTGDESETGSSGGALVMGQDHLKRMFDYFIESASVGLRKPDPAIYLKACEVVGVQPLEVVFLDDIGANLKSAQELGMTTIRVELGKSDKAIEQLSRLLGESATVSLSVKL